MQSVSSLIVSFDEEMATTGTGSVYNLSNYTLLKDSVVMPGTIAKIYYGLSDPVNGLSNLKDSSRKPADAGLTSPVRPHRGAHEQIRSSPHRRWQRRRRGHARNHRRQVASRGDEHHPRQSRQCVGQHGAEPERTNLSRASSNSPSAPRPRSPTASWAAESTNPNAQAVASDSNGDQAIAWSSSVPGQEGIYVKLLDAVWTSPAACGNPR